MPEMRPQLIERLSTLGPVLNAIRSATGAPSVSLGVAHEGETIFQWNSGMKDLRPGNTPDIDTVYGIGSLSKIFTASAVGILVEEGRVDWATPVREILPDFRSSNQFITDELTVADLLSHRSGMASSNEWWYGAGGELLFTKDQMMSFVNALKPIASLRSRYNYSNWNFAILGEIIEKLTGASYGTFVSSKILAPLGMNRTSASHIFGDDGNLALPYAVLDDLSAHELPMPKCEDDTIMAAAQGIQSTVNDLLKYSQALVKAYRHELELDSTPLPDSPLKNVAKQFSAFTSRGSPSFTQKAYCLGMHRHQLPNPFDGLGCNTMFVDQMPILSPGGDARLVLSHGGSLAGYTTFIALLPEINCSVAVLVNSIGLGDPAGWIYQQVIERLINSPVAHDYAALATEAAKNHAASFSQISEELNKTRVGSPPSKPLQDYVGRYQDSNRPFFVDIKLREDSETSLEIAFQGLDSQVWALEHHDGDTFLCFHTSFNDLAKRAIFTFLDEDYFKFSFSSNEASEITRLFWAHDGNVPASEQFFEKTSTHPGLSIQRPVVKMWLPEALQTVSGDGEGSRKVSTARRWAMKVQGMFQF